MTIDEMTEILWQSIQHGKHDPPELRGMLSIDTAYEVMLGLLVRHERAGGRLAGWKVGLTSKAIQAQIGLHEPVLGFLLESGHRSSGVTFELASLIAPRVENEVCITMGARLGGSEVRFEAARAAIASIAPAFEIIEQRHGATPDMALMLADNGQQKAYVTGSEVPLGEIDLAMISVEVSVNGEVRERAPGSAVLERGPIASVAWLANKLATFGRHLEPGMRVMSGSFTRQVDITSGDTVQARFDRIGTVTAHFE